MSLEAGPLKATLTLDDKDYTTKIEKNIKKTNSFSDAVKRNSDKIKKMGAAMTVAGGLVLAGLTKASQGAREFNEQIANISTLTDDSITSIIKLKDDIRELSVDAAKDTGDVAGGAYEVASAFGEAALQGKSLAINVKGAAAGLATTTQAIKLTSAVTKGFGDTSDEAQQKVMDFAFMTVKLGQTTFPELAASIGKVVPMYQKLGGQQEELFAQFATLTGVTGTAAEVSTQLASAMGALMKQTPPMQAAIKKVGQEQLGLADASAKTLVEELGLVGAFKALIGTTDGSITAISKLMARKEGLTAMLTLTGEQAGVFNQKLEAMSDSSGAADEAFKKMSQGVNAAGFSMEQANVKMQIAAQMIGESVTPIMADFKVLIADIVSGIAGWIKENPGLAKTIGTVTFAIGGLMAIAGPLAFALPALTKGFILLKGAMESMYIRGLIAKDFISGLITKMGGLQGALMKVGAVGVGAFVGWKVGRLISELLGLDKVVTKLWENFLGASASVETFAKATMEKMQFSEQAKQSLYLRDSLIAVAKQIDKKVTGLGAAARVLKKNNEEYEKLHPRLKRIVDGMTAVKTSTKTAADELQTVPEKTQGMIEAIEAITIPASERIKELTMAEADFKIYQLDRELAKNMEVLQANNATKEQILILERQYAIEVQKVRDEAYKKQKEIEIKRLEEEQKQKELEQKKLEEEIIHEAQMQEDHFDYLQKLREEQQDLILQDFIDREGWRAGELMKLETWHDEQMAQLMNRLTEGKIDFQQYQEELTALNDLEAGKREGIEVQHEKDLDEMRKNRLKKTGDMISNVTGIYSTFVNGLGSLFQALHDSRVSQLDLWYRAEVERIDNSQMSNEERATAIEALDEKMHEKKAALEAAAAKREHLMAKAEAIRNIAVGVTMAIRSAPWPWNIPAIAFAVLQGGIQLATIGASYSGPGVGSFSGGGSDAGGTPVGGGAGGSGTGRGAGGGAGVPKFATGTDGFIPAVREFIAGDPGPNQELVRLSGDIGGVGMSVTPVNNNAGTGKIQIDVKIDAVDSKSFMAQADQIKLFFYNMINEGLQNGYIQGNGRF